MSLKRRIEKREQQAAPHDMAPFCIEQNAPGAPVRFHLNGESVEMSADELRRCGIGRNSWLVTRC